MALRLVAFLGGFLSASQALQAKFGIDSIKKYELVQVTLDESDAAVPLMKFHAFSQDFEVELERNDDLNPAVMRHTNGHPSMQGDAEQIVTHLTESCHYFGKVVSHKEATPSQAAVSLCGKRGIRATLHIDSDTLYVRPAAIYLDTAREHHSFDDEYIVYYERDVEDGELLFGGAVPPPLDALRSNIESQVETQLESAGNVDGERRRMLYNGGVSQVEVLLILDPSIIKYFQGKYSSWYDQLTAQMIDTVNDINTVYTNNGGLGWPSNIGSIRVSIVEFLWIFQWSGTYLSLEPAEKCSDYSSCEIDGSAWLTPIKTWIESYKSSERTEFDNVMVFHNMDLGGSGQWSRTAGWGWKKTMCQFGWSASNNFPAFENYDKLWRTAAHELGHNFGMSHDQDTACGLNGGIMGYGTSAPDTFSSCSQSAISTCYADNSGLTCLSDSPPSSRRTNYDPNGGGSGVTTTTTTTTTTTRAPTSSSGTPAPTTSTTTTTSSNGDWGCVVASGLSNAALNGFWTGTGQTSSDKPVYTKDGMYLYSLWGVYWAFGTSVGSSSVLSYCSGAALASCSGGMFAGSERFSSCDDGNAPSSTISSTLSGCTYYSCLGIAGLSQDANGQDFNGQWSPQGCNAGQGYYSKVVGTSMLYFYKTSSPGYWMISRTVDSSSGYALCWQDSLADCSNNMKVYAGSSGWATDSTSMIYDCGGGAPFTGPDQACLGSRGYNEQLCVYHNNSDNALWTGYSPFKLYEMCINDQPVYTYSTFNSSTNTSLTYYLHFDEYYKYSDDNETSPRWIISKHEISTNGEAVCEEENLLNCVADKWVVAGRSTGPTDGFLQRVVESSLVVHNEQCEEDYVAETNKKNGAGGIIVIVICVLVLLACIVGGYCFWRKSNRDLNRQIHGTIQGGTKVKKTSDGGYAETEDIDVEVSVERDANTTVTND